MDVMKDFFEIEGVKSCSIVDEFPEKILVLKNGTRMVCLYVPERTAKKVKVPRKDHLRIGHVECGECGTPRGYNNRFCHHCGAKLEDES